MYFIYIYGLLYITIWIIIYNNMDYPYILTPQNKGTHGTAPESM